MDRPCYEPHCYRYCSIHCQGWALLSLPEKRVSRAHSKLLGMGINDVLLGEWFTTVFVIYICHFMDMIHFQWCFLLPEIDLIAWEVLCWYRWASLLGKFFAARDGRHCSFISLKENMGGWCMPPPPGGSITISPAAANPPVSPSRTPTLFVYKLPIIFFCVTSMA